MKNLQFQPTTKLPLQNQEPVIAYPCRHLSCPKKWFWRTPGGPDNGVDFFFGDSILLFHSLLPFFRINSYVLVVQFFLPFQLFLSIRCVCAFVSALLSCSFSSSFPFTLSISLRPSFRFNSSLLFVISFLSFQLSPHVSQKT